MKCPKCQSDKTVTLETTKTDETNFRRRMCNICFHTYKTQEILYVGTIPRKKRLTKAEPKEFQKTFSTDLLKRFWK